MTQCPENSNDQRAAGASGAAYSARGPAKFLLRHSTRWGRGGDARSTPAGALGPQTRDACARCSCSGPRRPLGTLGGSRPPCWSASHRLGAARGSLRGQEAGPRLFTSGRAAASRAPAGMRGSSRRPIQQPGFVLPLRLAPPCPATSWAWPAARPRGRASEVRSTQYRQGDLCRSPISAAVLDAALSWVAAAVVAGWALLGAG